MTMIYMIFACILVNPSTGEGNCKPIPFGEFSTAAQCHMELLKLFGPGLYVKGELIPDATRTKGSSRQPLSANNWNGEWYECDGKPTWSEAQ